MIEQWFVLDLVGRFDAKIRCDNELKRYVNIFYEL
jgi:hypothetical protein